MSHRLSQNARHTKDLLEELERDKELDVLREYLTRFELFPRQRDPAAAPIRFEELKELAKHWKLHRQRNFWKTNTTKEDLVRTLYRHINTKIIPQEARDENNANGLGSPAHMVNSPAATPSPAAVTFAESPRNRSITGVLRPTPPPTRGPRVDSVFGGYGGDLFGQRGSYEDGMIYLSRFRKTTTLLNDVSGVSGSLNSYGGSDATLSRQSRSKFEEDDDEDEQEPTADALDFGAGMSREIRLKQECAFSIYHFSTIPGHERQMVAEGCMLALSKLAVFEDTEVKRFCAASILNLLCESQLGNKMADEGVLLALLELAKAQHEEVRRHTSMSLCRFSYERAGQLRLVQEGCVSAIVSMLNVPDLETKEACVKALINIASASGTSVAESVVHVLMKLATRKDQASAKFAAQAICNLSLLSGSRAKVVEEGILDTVCELVQQTSVAAVASASAGGDAEDGGEVGTIRKHLATALCNLSGLSGNLEPLSSGRILECLEELLKCEKPREVRQMCAVTIANISSYPPSLKNLALSDAVANLVEIGMHHSSASIRENTALCLSNMTATADSRALLARFGVVSLLLRYVEEDEGTDAGASAQAQQFAVLTLCSMLAHPAACVEILQSNMPAAIARLATRTPNDRVRDLCANALFNVSCEKSLHGVLLQDDTIRTIVRLCRRKGDVDDEVATGTSATPSTPAAGSGPPTVLLRYQECALGCLLNLSFAPESRPALLRADVVATLAKVFNKPPVRADELLRQCAGVLANLSFDAEARARMVADHGVRLLRRIMSAATSSAAAAVASDVPVSASAIAIIRETLRCCSTACCNLATDALEKTPVLDMLIDLSASSYPPTTLTCAIAFAKLASSATHRALLTRCAELYPALTLMMRCGVEDIQIYSAVALCNLAVEPPAAKPVGVRYVWKEGTVPDFIVNALLRINSDSTKEICARALFNLLTHDELRAAHIKDGVLYALVKLARLESVEIRTLCVTALYNLSCDPALAETLMELKVAQVITKLCEMEFSSQEIHRKLAACLTNLASEPKPPSAKKVVTSDATASGGSPSMAVRLVESGALVALLVLCEHADPPTRHACAAALCFLSAYRVNCEAVAVLGLVDVLTKKLLLAPLDAGTSDLENVEMELEQRQQYEFALNALCNISCFPALHDRMEEAGAVQQIIRVLAVNSNRGRGEENCDHEDEAMVLVCVQTLGNLTFHARHRRAMLTHSLVPTLLSRPQILRSSPRVGDVCAEIVAALCEDPLHWHELIATGAVRVLREITDVTEGADGPLPVSQTALRAAIYALSQLARCEKFGDAVITDGAFDVVARALDLGKDPAPLGEDQASKKAHEARQETAERCAVILRALSTQGESVCLMLMRDVRLVPLMHVIIKDCCPGRRQMQASKHVILAFYNLTSCRITVEDDNTNSTDNGDEKIAKLNESEGMRGLDAMVISGVVPLLIRLSTDSGTDMAPACAVALAHIKHRIKERLALAQSHNEGPEQQAYRREFEEMDNLMEAGVVTALLAMFELDPAGIQRVDRLAAAMPPALAILRTEKDWIFLTGNSTLRYETPLPVCWDFRSSAIDDARFVPAEPRTFLSVLAPVVPLSGTSIQDKLYGRFQILQVRLNKCLLRLENSRFAKLANALLGSGQARSAASSVSDLSDAIAMAIGEVTADVDDNDHERGHSDQARQGNNVRKSTIGSSTKPVANSVTTDEGDAGSETRIPSPVKKRPTGRALIARALSNRGNLSFGVGANTSSNADNVPRRVSKTTSPHTVVRRPSRSSIHDNNHSSSSSIASSSARSLGGATRRDSSHRLNSDSSGVTLPRI